MRTHVSLVLVAALSGCGNTIRDYTIREDFEVKPTKPFYVCKRPENEFHWGFPRENGLTAMVSTVHPAPKAFAGKHYADNCQRIGDDYKPEDQNERAEIWETQNTLMPL